LRYYEKTQKSISPPHNSPQILKNEKSIFVAHKYTSLEKHFHFFLPIWFCPYLPGSPIIKEKKNPSKSRSCTLKKKSNRKKKRPQPNNFFSFVDTMSKKQNKRENLYLQKTIVPKKQTIF